MFTTTPFFYMVNHILALLIAAFYRKSGRIADISISILSLIIYNLTIWSPIGYRLCTIRNFILTLAVISLDNLVKKQCCRVYLVSMPLILLFLLWCVTVNQTAADDIAALIAEHQRRLQETPESPEVHLQWGQAYLAVEDFDRGLIHHQKALELNPNLTMAHYG